VDGDLSALAATWACPPWPETVSPSSPDTEVEGVCSVVPGLVVEVVEGVVVLGVEVSVWEDDVEFVVVDGAVSHPDRNVTVIRAAKKRLKGRKN